jgi:hypothetical protein
VGLLGRVTGIDGLNVRFEGVSGGVCEEICFVGVAVGIRDVKLDVLERRASSSLTSGANSKPMVI